MATKLNPPTKHQVVSLFRALLRTSYQFSDYNIRHYVKRQALDRFRHNRKLSDPVSISNAYADGVAQLEVAQRQSLVYSLYQPKVQSILEVKGINLNDDDASN